MTATGKHEIGLLHGCDVGETMEAHLAEVHRIADWNAYLDRWGPKDMVERNRNPYFAHELVTQSEWLAVKRERSR